MIRTTPIARFPRLGLALIVAVLTTLAGSALQAQEGEGALETWLERQAEIETWAADVVQTRRLRSLVRPLESSGQVWFARPDRFRWQLGDPPRTIAIRTPESLEILYPRLKQLERYPFGADIDESWRQALALLEVGFPEDAELFRQRYELLSTERLEDRWRFELQPRESGARTLISKVIIEVAPDDWRLLATELAFPEGSTMRNDFSEHRLGIELEPGLFEAAVGDDWDIREPLAGNR
jgi:outer membrane lipoprotein-sorting protein